MSAGQNYRGMSDLARLTHHAERGTPAGSLKSFSASALFERCKLSHSLPDILAVGATLLFCLSGPLVTIGVTAVFIIRRAARN